MARAACLIVRNDPTRQTSTTRDQLVDSARRRCACSTRCRRWRTRRRAARGARRRRPSGVRRRPRRSRRSGAVASDLAHRPASSASSACLVPVADHDRGPLGDEPAGGRQPDARGAPPVITATLPCRRPPVESRRPSDSPSKSLDLAVTRWRHDPPSDRAICQGGRARPWPRNWTVSHADLETGTLTGREGGCHGLPADRRRQPLLRAARRLHPPPRPEVQDARRAAGAGGHARRSSWSAAGSTSSSRTRPSIRSSCRAASIRCSAARSPRGSTPPR